MRSCLICVRIGSVAAFLAARLLSMFRSSSDPVPLTELRAGAHVKLHEARVDSECREWLRALGLTDASDLRLCKHGDPCIIQVRSTRIGLSRAVASRVFVLDAPATSEP